MVNLFTNALFYSRSGLNKRKICPYCDQYFANSYIAVHQENCTSKQQEMNVTLSSHSSTDDEDFDGAGSAAIVSQEYSELERYSLLSKYGR